MSMRSVLYIAGVLAFHLLSLSVIYLLSLMIRLGMVAVFGISFTTATWVSILILGLIATFRTIAGGLG